MPLDVIPLLVIGGWVLLSASVGVPLIVGITRQRRSLRDARRSKARLA
jgi:hypothetical protein